VFYKSYITAEGGVVSVPHLLVHDPADNVGVVVVEGLTASTDMLCVVTHDDSDFRLVVGTDVPIGHKVALKDLAVGDTVVKYGQDIGRIVAPVKRGEHVHVHNLKTKRW
jgi:(2R)-sulfolactate sulfo-lyase subunit alpha